MNAEQKRIYRGVLRSVVRRHLAVMTTRIAASDAPPTVRELADAVLRAVLEAGSEASWLIGPESMAQVLLELCPPREPTKLESLSGDIACLVEDRRARLRLQPWAWEFDSDLRSQLIRLFTAYPALALMAAEYVHEYPLFDDEAQAEGVCTAIERALRGFIGPTEH